MKNIIIAVLISLMAIVPTETQAHNRTGEAIAGAAVILGLSIAASKLYHKRHRHFHSHRRFYDDPYGEHYFDRGSRHWHYRGYRHYRDWRDYYHD